MAAKGSKIVIFQAAQAAFIAGGGEFEMEEVAKRANVSIGLAYHYFGSKAGLTTALIGDFYDRYDNVINRRFDQDTPWSQREYRRLLMVVEFLFKEPMAPLMLGRLSGTAAVMAVEAARRDAIIALGAVNIQGAQEKAEIANGIDPELASAAINGGLREAIALALKRPERPDAVAFTDQMWGLVAGALGLRPKLRQPKRYPRQGN